MSRESNSGQFQSGRRPHNIKVLAFDTLGELVRHIGAQPRTVTMKGKPVKMTRAERSFRLMLDRALKGNVQDLAEILRLMIKHPQVVGRGRLRQIIVIRGALADC
jgi:hypothetical protein